MSFVIVGQHLFGELWPEVIGPFKTEEQAQQWRDKFTEHEINLVWIKELVDAEDIVLKHNLRE